MPRPLNPLRSLAPRHAGLPRALSFPALSTRQTRPALRLAHGLQLLRPDLSRRAILRCCIGTLLPIPAILQLRPAGLPQHPGFQSFQRSPRGQLSGCTRHLLPTSNSNKTHQFAVQHRPALRISRVDRFWLWLTKLASAKKWRSTFLFLGAQSPLQRRGTPRHVLQFRPLR